MSSDTVKKLPGRLPPEPDRSGDRGEIERLHSRVLELERENASLKAKSMAPVRAEDELIATWDETEACARERTRRLTQAIRILNQEIAEHKQVEKELKESEKKFRVLAETSPAAIFVYSGEDILYTNPAASQITGYSPDELLGMKFWGWFSPEFKPLVRQRMIARQRGEPVPRRYEVKYMTKDGRERWADFAAGLIEFGGRTAVIATALDVTERKQAEKALRKSQYILAKSQEIAHVGNWAWNLQTDELNWSDESYRIFGHRPQEFPLTLGWFISRVHPEDQKMLQEFSGAIRGEGRLGSIDFRVVRPDGSVRYVNSVADKIARDREGNPKWVYGINQDITRRKQAEKAMGEAKSRAELYLDLMSHDINNMNQIGIGYLEMAIDTLNLDEKVREMIARPIEALKSSSTLIDNVRKLQRISEGGLRYYEVDVDEMIRGMIPKYSGVAGRDVRIVYAGCECRVVANELLQDVFANILGNSIKHSAGPLTIKVAVKRVSVDGDDFCQVSVEDDGPGIPDDRKAWLFEGPGRRGGERGLGLYLIKTLVDDFHGRAWLEDRVPGDPTKGCRFIVKLPVTGEGRG